MKMYHLSVHILGRIVVVPVYECKILVRFVLLLPFIVFGNTVITSVFGCQHEIHITPDHRIKLVFPADRAYPVLMLFHNSGTVLISVLSKIITEPQLKCLIHSDMNALA